MDKNKFARYKRNKKEILMLDSQLDRLYDQLEDVPVVSGKVSGSSRNFPYIKSHMTVQMAEPQAATAIKDKIREKENRRKRLEEENKEVEEFIDCLPEGCDKRIMEMVYLDGASQRSAADAVGYTQGRVAQIIKQVIQD